MSRSVFFLVAAWGILSSAPLMAQDAVLTQIYGNGVHAYFNQDYLKAHQLLTTAIDGHSQDPRCYYFRGLALIKLGRPQDAESDFQQGAKLESASDSARSYSVARALERVQGSDRSTLEQYRIEARMTVLKKLEDERRVKYEEGLKEQRTFLQQQSESGPAKTVGQPAGVKPEVPGEAAKPAGTVPPANPFSTGDEGKAGTLKPDAVKPGAVKPDGAVEPVKPDATKPAGGDPFGDASGAAKPAVSAEMPEATKAAAPAGAVKPDAAKPDAADPFGDAGAAKPAVPAAKPDAVKPDAADPFGDAGGAKPATPAAKPDAVKPDASKPADGGDPFGDAAAKPAAPVKPDAAKPDAAKPADAKPADAKPADAKPADAKKPAEKKPDEKKPADDNPFG